MGKANREAAWLAIKRDPDLGTGAAFLLVYVGDLVSDDEGTLTAGCDYLASETGRSVSSVRRWRSELVSAGYLLPLFEGAGGDKANAYRLNTPPPVDGYPSARGRVTPPRPLQDPSARGGKQEQEQKAAAASDFPTDDELAAMALVEARRKARVVKAVPIIARRILTEDRGRLIGEWHAQRKAKSSEEASTRAAAAIASCVLCDHRGYRLDADGEADVIRCDHKDLA